MSKKSSVFRVGKQQTKTWTGFLCCHVFLNNQVRVRLVESVACEPRQSVLPASKKASTKKQWNNNANYLPSVLQALQVRILMLLLHAILYIWYWQQYLKYQASLTKVQHNEKAQQAAMLCWWNSLHQMSEKATNDEILCFRLIQHLQTSQNLWSAVQLALVVLLTVHL